MRGLFKFICYLPILMILVIINGCGNGGNEDTDTASSVWFSIEKTNKSNLYHGTGNATFGDVYDSKSGGVTADWVEMILLHHFKGSSDTDYTGYTSINIYAYSVYYERSEHDKALGGYEVPSPLEKIAINYTVPTTVVDDDKKKLNIEVTTIQQKIEAPLSYLQDGGFEPNTGLYQIQCNVFITLYAKDGAGNELQPKTGNLPIYYTDYANE
jgi:hypothetical protein